MPVCAAGHAARRSLRRGLVAKCPRDTPRRPAKTQRPSESNRCDGQYVWRTLPAVAFVTLSLFEQDNLTVVSNTRFSDSTIST